MHAWSLAGYVWSEDQYTMSTGGLIPILVLFTSKMQICTFWYILLLCESPFLVQFLITDLKQNKRNNKKKSREDVELLQTFTDSKN